jgi:hypothetical protein
MHASSEIRRLHETLDTPVDPSKFSQADFYWRQARKNSQIREEHELRVAEHNAKAAEWLLSLRLDPKRFRNNPPA